MKGEKGEGCISASSHINEASVDVVRAFLGSLVLQNHSSVFICRSHDRSHDPVTSLT